MDGKCFVKEYRLICKRQQSADRIVKLIKFLSSCRIIIWKMTDSSGKMFVKEEYEKKWLELINLHKERGVF